MGEPTNQVPVSMLARLYELKAMWNSEKNTPIPLPVGPVPSPSKTSGDTSSAKASSKEKDLDMMASDKKGRKKRKIVDTTGLQDYIKRTIEEEGGSSHIDTITECVKRVWSQFFAENTAPSDVKRQIKGLIPTMKAEAPSKENVNMFVSDKFNEGCYVINPTLKHNTEEQSKGQVDPLIKYITKVLDDQESVSFDSISSFIHRNWEKSRHLSNAAISEKLRLVLETHPRISKEGLKDDHYKMLDKKKRRKNEPEPQQTFAQPQTELGSSAGGRGKRRKSTAPLTPVQYAVNSLCFNLPRYSMELEHTPPTGKTCNGCTKMASPTWFHGPNVTDWYCRECGETWSGQHACPLCGLVYEDEDNEDEDADSNWIACDVCSRWVMTKCDGITDLSLYDDDNPNHLHYSCPLCRKERDTLPHIFFTKQSAQYFHGYIFAVANRPIEKKGGRGGKRTKKDDEIPNGTVELNPQSRSPPPVSIREQCVSTIHQWQQILLEEVATQADEPEYSQVKEEVLEAERKFTDKLRYRKDSFVEIMVKQMDKNRSKLEYEDKVLRDQQEELNKEMQRELQAQYVDLFQKEKDKLTETLRQLIAPQPPQLPPSLQSAETLKDDMETDQPTAVEPAPQPANNQLIPAQPAALPEEQPIAVEKPNDEAAMEVVPGGNPGIHPSKANASLQEILMQTRASETTGTLSLEAQETLETPKPTDEVS